MADVEFTISAIDKATGAISGIRGAILSMNQAVQLAGQVYQAVSRVVDETISSYVKYADEVRRLSQLNGTNAEETSRLIQVTDDYKISVDALNMATRKLSGEGLSLTTEQLAIMSDEYISLGTSAEKTRFLLDNFGRTGTTFAEIMGAGSAAIREQSAATEDGLVLTDAAVVAARNYEKALDANADKIMAIKVAIGQYLLPALMFVNDFILYKSIPGWQEFGKTIDIILERAILKSWDVGRGIKNALDISNESWASGVIDWFWGVRGTAVQTIDVLGAVPPTIEDIAAAADALNKTLMNQTGWEAMYTGASDAAARSKQSLDMLGEGIQGIGEEGSEVWRAFLIASGSISEPAIREFIKIEQTIAAVRAMLAGGFSADFIVNIIMGTRREFADEKPTNVLPSGSVVPAVSSSAYWIPDPSDPGHYIENPNFKASGGYVSGRYAITGDSLSGRRTGYEELVDFQTRRVYSAPETQAMGAVPGYAAGSGEITLSRQSITELRDAIMYGVAALQ
jgi:hypothetical protein